MENAHFTAQHPTCANMPLAISKQNKLDYLAMFFDALQKKSCINL